MGCSNLVQPGLNNNLENQVNIAHSLFNVILAMVQKQRGTGTILASYLQGH